jgi:ornithine cyclodeaminase/alanine dehydrogenase-like protein (mu-crystallin family)
LKVLVLDAKEVAAACKMRACIDEMAKAFAMVAEGKADSPQRTRLAITEKRDILVMPSLVRRKGPEASFKVLSVIPDGGPGVPAIRATVLLMDGRDGTTKAVVEGGTLTGIRTGAVSGLSCRYLARKDSRELGIVGAGTQAYYQVAGVNAGLGVERVKIFSKDLALSKGLARRVKKDFGLECRVVGTSAECVRSSDVVVTATTSSVPVFDGRDISEGTHVIAMGSYRPANREVDSVFVSRATIFADSREACMEEAGDLLIPIREGVLGSDPISAELTELVTGKKPGRRSETEITFFKSVGLAFEDNAAGWLAYRKAKALGIGRTIEL